MGKKYALVTGTRPQIIKSVPVLRAARIAPSIEIVHIFTGQHYDSYMADVFFRELEVDTPEHHLNVRSGSIEYHIRSIIEKLVVILKKDKFNGILVPGDTNSALAAALAGLFLAIPVIHLEAGLRSYDLRMQEEINRRLIDHGSSVLFTPTTTATTNLKNESVLGKVVHSGDTMYDLLLSEKEKILDKNLFAVTAKTLEISEKNYQVITLHRRENLNDLERIRRILSSIGQSNILSILPLHPHTKKIINSSKIEIPSNLRMIDPLSYRIFLNLVAYSGLIVTDSGGLQKEAFLLDVPCVTLRDSTEWVETVEENANIVVGANDKLICQAIDSMYNKKLKTNKKIYGDGKASEYILREIARNDLEIPSIPKI